jgi:hypothetical protein
LPGLIVVLISAAQIANPLPQGLQIFPEILSPAKLAPHLKNHKMQKNEFCLFANCNDKSLDIYFL